MAYGTLFISYPRGFGVFYYWLQGIIEWLIGDGIINE